MDDRANAETLRLLARRIKKDGLAFPQFRDKLIKDIPGIYTTGKLRKLITEIWHDVLEEEEGIAYTIESGFMKMVSLKGLKEPFVDMDVITCQLIDSLIGHGFAHIDPNGFEEIVRQMFLAFGFSAELTQATGDEGIDIFLKSPDGKLGIVQCKRYDLDNKISPPAVRELVGSMMHVGAKFGYFITTSSFSSQAKAFCAGKNIELVDGHELKKLFMLAFRNQIVKENLAYNKEAVAQERGKDGINNTI